MHENGEERPLWLINVQSFFAWLPRWFLIRTRGVNVTSAKQNLDETEQNAKTETKCQFFLYIYICFNSLQPTDPAEFHSSLCSFLWPPLCSCPSLKASILPSQLSDSNWTLACCCYWESSVLFLGCYISLKDVIVPLASGRSSSCLHVMQKATASVFSLWRLHQPLPGCFSLLSL